MKKTLIIISIFCSSFVYSQDDKAFNMEILGGINRGLIDYETTSTFDMWITQLSGSYSIDYRYKRFGLGVTSRYFSGDNIKCLAIYPSLQYYIVNREKYSLVVSTGFGWFTDFHSTPYAPYPFVYEESNYYCTSLSFRNIYKLNKSFGLVLGLRYGFYNKGNVKISNQITGEYVESLNTQIYKISLDFGMRYTFGNN